MGAPISEILGIVHFKSKLLDRTILNIFCTLMLCEVEQKIKGAFIALANFLACLVISSCSSLGNDAK